MLFSNNPTKDYPSKNMMSKHNIHIQAGPGQAPNPSTPNNTNPNTKTNTNTNTSRNTLTRKEQIDFCPCENTNDGLAGTEEMQLYETDEGDIQIVFSSYLRPLRQIKKLLVCRKETERWTSRGGRKIKRVLWEVEPLSLSQLATSVY